MPETRSVLSSQPSLPPVQGNHSDGPPEQTTRVSTSQQAEGPLGGLQDSPPRRPASSASGTPRRPVSPPASSAPPNANEIETEIVSPAALRLIIEKIEGLKSDIAGISASLGVLIPYHCEIKKLVHSVGVAALTREERSDIARLEDSIQSGLVIEQHLKGLLRTLARPPSAEARARSADIPGSEQSNPKWALWVGMGGVTAGMLAKNAAFNLSALVARARSGDPVTLREIGTMTGVGYGEALGGEYPLWNAGLYWLLRLGFKPNRIAGGAQVLDQGFAATTQVMRNHFSEEPLPKGYQYIGYGGAALGGLFTSDALPFFGIKDDRFSPIEGLRDDPETNRVTGGTSSSPVEGDEGAFRGNSPSASREEGSGQMQKLQASLGQFPTDALEQMQRAAEKVHDSLPELVDAIFNVPGMHHAPDIEAQAAPAAHVTGRSSPELIESIQTDIGKISVALGRCCEHIQFGADALEAEALKSMLREIETSVNGSNAKATIFAAGAACLYVLCLIAGTVGLVKGESAGRLGDKYVLAVIFALASNIAQAFANWAQVVGGARPYDSALAKVLKGGLAERGSPTQEFFKNMGRAAVPLALEYAPLEIASALSGAPSIRAIQEAVRALMSQALLTVHGSKAGAPQLVGVTITALTAAAVVAMERKFNPD